MFEDSTFESQGRIRTRSKRWMVAALGFNGSILAALIVIPLIYPSALPMQPLPYLIAAMQPPKGPQPLRRQPAEQAATNAVKNILDPFQAPRRIPPSIFIASSPEPRDFVGIPGGDPGPGNGTPFGVGDDPFSHANQPTVHPEPKVIHVSTGTEEGLIVFKTIPQYPMIAKTMRVEGTVELAATISKSGTIENLRVMSGPVMLQQAAVDAVKTWRYRPYMLDGQPVEVETSVNVVFRMQR
jgi:protein TonB